jgi:type IV secretory pathway VirB3-like protein
MIFVNRDKLEKFLNLLLGVSWSMVVFGTISILLISLQVTSIPLAIIITFLFFFLLSIVVLFLESLKIQLEQIKKVDKLLQKFEVKESEI